MNLALERRIHLVARETATPYAPYIIAAFQDDRELHLLIEYAPYGSLWDAMWNRPNQQAGNMHQKEIKWWAAQMALGIQWLHGQGYIHRSVGSSPISHHARYVACADPGYAEISSLTTFSFSRTPDSN